MTSIKNTLSSTVDSMVKLQATNAELYSKLSDIINSDVDTVTLKIQDSNGQIKTVSIPSMGSLKKDIQRLDENIKQISSLDGKSASVQLNDGTFRTIIKSTLKRNAETITSVDIPTNFKSTNNWFFENFLNPYLYVSLDFGQQLNPDTTKVKKSKFILIIDSDKKRTVYNEQIKNVPNLSYSDFIDIINNNGILYNIDDEVLDLPPVEPTLYGNFSVLAVNEISNSVLINGVSTPVKTLNFVLDKLKYNDKNSVSLETQQLKIGDSLLVNKNDRNTRYIITNLDFSTSTVEIRLVEGYDSVQIGTDVLSYYNESANVPEVRVGIGFNEYSCIFIKPIDPISQRPADEWSPCVSVFTNELTILDTDGALKTLDTYYKESVIDFGAVMISMAKENLQPLSRGITPDAPVLLNDNFKVIQINKHLTDVSSNDDIQKLNRDKNNLKSELYELDKSIALKKSEISTKTYKSDFERNDDNNILSTLVDKRKSTETLYNSTVSDILTKGKDTTLSAAQDKFNLRGFFEMPLGKVAADGSVQEVIQFIFEYRYLTKGGAANNLDTFDVNTSDGKIQKAVYSNWTRFKSNLRNRILDPNGSGKYVWEIQNLENGEQVNINQLSIPIQPNESIEVRVISISEAGYPSTPIQSSYSEVMKFDFPDNLGLNQDILAILKETNSENIQVSLTSDLESKGVFTHIDDQIVQNNLTWKHQAFNISSGFLTTERNIISLFDYLKTLQDQIANLTAIINKEIGALVVRITDSNGNSQIIQNNETLIINTATYKEAVANIQNPKGTIVSKVFDITFENGNSTPVVLKTIDGGSKYENTSLTYEAPIGIISVSTEEANSSNAFRVLPFGNSQRKGQYLNLNDSSLNNINEKLYEIKNTVSFTYDPNKTNSANYIDYTTANENFIFQSYDINGDKIINGAKIENLPSYTPSSNVYVHCEYFRDPDTDKDSTSFGISVYSLVSPTGNESKNPSYVANQKIGFFNAEKYFIGQNSCGSYLFVASSNIDNIRVDGNARDSIRTLNNTTKLQVVFQYRLTDYFGPGQNGIGNIGGIDGATNASTSKKLGLVIYNNDGTKFSFDLQVNANYKSDSVALSDIPVKTITNTLGSGTTPNVI